VSGPGSFHVIVINGMQWINNGMGQYVPVLFINDPMSIYVQPLLYSRLMQVWRAAIVIY
jgi:hypothetical protein